MTACTGAEPIRVESDQIVSTSLCADSYLLAMPDLHPRLGALSWQSRSSLSRAPELLADLPQAGEGLEHLMRFSNATLVTGPGPAAFSKPTLHLAWGEDFETVWRNFSTLSQNLNARDPSDDLKSRLQNLPSLPTRPRLLYLDRSGASAGPGTFVDAVFKAVGAENVITTPGWQSPDTETLLQLQPDFIVTSFMDSDYAGVNDTSLRHAALAKYIDAVPQIDISGSLWPCAGPGLVDAAETLSAGLVK